MWNEHFTSKLSARDIRKIFTITFQALIDGKIHAGIGLENMQQVEVR